MRHRIGLWGGLLALSLIACSKDPRAVRVTDNNKDKFIEEIKDLKGLSVDESRLLFTFFMRHNLSSSFGQTPPTLVGKTVGDLISEQRTFEKDAQKQESQQTRLAVEAKATEDALAAEFRKAISLTVFQKDFLASDSEARRYQSYINIKCVYKNTSSKDIRAFTGSIRFTDLFDKPIYESNLTISDPIKAGAKANWTGSIEYNQFASEHQALKNANLKDLKIVWVPKSIIYADGTKVGKTGN